MSALWKAPLHDFPIRDEILHQYLPLSSDMEVLEVGPGSGITAFRLARHVRRLTLLDIASANIEKLRQALRGIPNVRVICADVCKPGLPSQIGTRFDAAYAIEVFEYLPDPDTCLKNLAAMLRPGGSLLLQFPNYPPPRCPGITHFKTRRELDQMLQEAGFATWNVYALRLRPHARLLYEHFHERPLRLYRRLRNRSTPNRPLIYDDSWTFQHQHRLEPFKYLLNGLWGILAAAIHLGGDCFDRQPLNGDIASRNILILARKPA